MSTARFEELSTRTGGMESLPLRQRHLVPFPASLRQRTVEYRAALVKQIDFVGKLLGPRRHRDLNDPIISHVNLRDVARRLDQALAREDRAASEGTRLKLTWSKESGQLRPFPETLLMEFDP